MFWKTDWTEAQAKWLSWWQHKGLALHITAPKDQPWEKIDPPPRATSLEERWLDPRHRVQSALAQMSKTFFGGAAFPLLATDIGPGSLGLFLDGIGRVGETTVWYEPSIPDPDQCSPLRFDTGNLWWKRHLAIIEEAVRVSAGRYLVGCPDLIENIDTLAQLRGSEALLIDLIERPEWVKEKLAEINQAFFQAFDAIHGVIADCNSHNAFGAFSIWGPGKTAKVQCDFSCMISAEMFREFVVPPLAEQCKWLDYSIYHLDGTQALHHIPALCEIADLDAIEWTPQSGLPGGGDPRWYDVYRQIKRGGKSVQAIWVEYDEVLPMIDAVGPEGMLIQTTAPTEKKARELLERVASC